MILSFLFYAFVIYLAYRLVFFFILPIVRTTQQVKRSFRQMNQQMNGHTQQTTQATGPSKKPPTAGKEGDYIDFEEIKSKG